MTKSYTGKDIKVLSDRDHIRLRTNLVFGSMQPETYKVPSFVDGFSVNDVTFTPALYKCVGEIFDNALDEFAQISSKVKLLKIDAKPDVGWYSISDNGRGVPIDLHETGKYTPEVVFGSLRSGRNFTDEKEKGVLGQNGLGSSACCFCSTEFDVSIYRDNHHYHQRFVDGALKISKPKITSRTQSNTGTTITFQLDPTVFKNVEIPEVLIRNRAIEIAMTNPDVTVEYNGERYRYKKGIYDIISTFAADNPCYCFDVNEPNVTGEIYLILNAHDNLDEQMYTWVNSSLLFDGGKCNVQFFNGLFDRTLGQLEKEAKKLKAEVTKNDVRQGLLVLANLKIKNPEYDSQSKTRLTGPDLRREIVGAIDNHWKTFIRTHKQWLTEVLERATERHHMQENERAITDHEKKRKLRKKPEGLLDASSRNRSECRILITEGESAKSKICEARNPKIDAAFALTGKINNVYGCTVAQVLGMGKLTDLLAAIGLTPGKKAIRSNLNYGQIVISSDADQDGSDIMTLLVNMFYTFWPELLDPAYEPIIYRLIVPNVVVSKGGKRIHFPTRDEYEKVKTKYNSWTVEYMKGLGSMNKKDWELVLSCDDYVIPIVDDGNMKPTLELLFGDNADDRKLWLTAPTDTVPVEN